VSCAGSLSPVTMKDFMSPKRSVQLFDSILLLWPFSVSSPVGPCGLDFPVRSPVLSLDFYLHSLACHREI
jgi:hypothetical protein